MHHVMTDNRTRLLKKLSALCGCVVIGLLLWGMPLQAAEEIRAINIVTPDWPNQTNEDGSGLFFDILRAVYEPEGIEVTFRITSWNGAEALVQKGYADARLAVMRSNDEQVMPLYPLYIDSTAAVFKKETFPDWKGMETLDGARAVWPRGYAYDQEPPFQGIQFQSIDEIDKPEHAWNVLKFGRVDVYLDALFDLGPYIKQQQINMTPYRIEVVDKKPCYVEFAKTERTQHLMDTYDKRMPLLLESGELEAIFEKWEFPFESFGPRQE